MATHLWHVRSVEGGSTGLEVANARLAATETVLAHALPRVITVEVRDEDGASVARADRLEGDDETPIARLTMQGGTIRRTQIWPTESDLGTPVILPGGEVGILTAWWHADDHSEWRWSIELHNRA